MVDDAGSPSGASSPTGTCEAPNYGTIQAAVDAATAGDTIEVCAGTYVEDPNVDKQITLVGPNAGISAGWDAGTREPEATIQGEMNISAADTVIDGLEFVRPDVPTNTVPKLIEAVGVSEQITVRNSSFDLRVFGSEPASVGCGSAVWGRATWTVEDNGFANQFYTGGSSACGSSGNLYNSRVVWLDGAQPSVVRGNDFEKTGQGVYITGSEPAGTVVESNTFNGGLGVLVGSTAGVEIRGNSFLAGNGPYLDSSTDTVIENNLLCGGAGGGPEDPSFPDCVSRTGAMIWTTGTQSGAVASENALLGGYASSVVAPFGGRGIFNYGPNDLDLRDNWWGGLSGSAIAAKRYENPGGIPFAPWIASYTPDPAREGEPGFWPTEVVTGPCTTTCYVNEATGNDSNGGTSPDDAFKTIQKGIDTASAGGTVIVAAGTYSDEQTGDFTDIYIPPGKDGLTVRGAADQAAPVVELNELKPDESGRQVAGVDIRSDGVTIEGIDFEPAPAGDYGPQVNFRIAANAENPDGVQGFTLREVTSTGSYGQNIQIQKGDTAEAIVTHSDLVFDQVTIEDSGGRGIYVAPNEQVVDGFTVEDSSIDSVGLNPAVSSDPGSKQGIQVAAPVQDVSITNSTFTGVPSGGINFLSGVSGEANLIEDVTIAETVAANETQSGISVFNLRTKPGGGVTTAENITINRATVTDFAGRGILVGAADYGECEDGCVVDDVTIQNSIVTDPGDFSSGVMLTAFDFEDRLASVTNVTIRDNEFDLTNRGDYGVYVEKFDGTVTGFEITGNTFAGGLSAVETVDDVFGSINRNSLRAGSAGDPAVGVGTNFRSPGADALDATCNWWGQATGPAEGQAVGDVNTGAGTLRFLQSAGLDSPCLGTPQPTIDPVSFDTVGSLVTLQNAGSWDIPEGTGPLTLGYQWEACDFPICEPDDWSPIAGATGATYRLSESDLGKRLRAIITATNPGPNGGSATYPALDAFRNPFGPIIAPSSSAEEFTPAGEDVQVSFPAIDNGQQISLDFGCEITEEGTTTVQSRDASQVPEAEGFRFGDPPTAATIETTAVFDCEGEEVVSVCTTYDVDSLPEGVEPRMFHFVDSPAPGEWQDVTVSWDPETGILCGDVDSLSPFAVGRAAATPENTDPPEITGTAKVGETLTASTGTWTGDEPIEYAYQWQRCDSAGENCSDIIGASTTSYIPVAADAGKKLKVEVTATNDGGSGSATSALTATVEAEPVPPSGDPNLKVNLSSPKKVRAGKAFAASVKVSNRSEAPAARSTRSAPARELRTCVRLPKGTAVLKAKGAKVSGRSVCWTRSSLAVGKSATYRVRIKVFRSASGKRTLRATASAKNDAGRAATANGKRQVRILKAPRLRPDFPTS